MSAVNLSSVWSNSPIDGGLYPEKEKVSSYFLGAQRHWRKIIKEKVSKTDIGSLATAIGTIATTTLLLNYIGPHYGVGFSVTCLLVHFAIDDQQVNNEEEQR